MNTTDCQLKPCSDVSVPTKAQDIDRIQLQTAWLMQDPASCIEAAWQANAVRYNHLIKDIDDMPEWYRTSVIGQIERRPYTHRKPQRYPSKASNPA